jgi:cytidyltransferase-like protein
MTVENGLFDAQETQFHGVLDKLSVSPEIKYAFEYSIQKPQWSEVGSLLPPNVMSMVDFCNLQQRAKEELASILPDLYAIYDPNRESIEKSLFANLTSLATSGVISLQEIEELFKCHQLSWSEYWSESKFNQRIYSLFGPPKEVRHPPYEKYVALEAVYDLANLWRQEGRRVVSVMGTFDFHTGHAEFLDFAREFAGQGLLIALVTSDKEASIARPEEKNILTSRQRLNMVASHHGVDLCAELPWEEEFRNEKLFDLHMKDVHQKLGAHFRYIGELDERTNLIAGQCISAGTRLVYQNEKRAGGLSSTTLRGELIGNS